MSTAPIDGGWFGAGGAEPWARTLRRGRGDLVLLPDGGAAERLDAARWDRAADPVDRAVLDGLAGPVLDVGCGPGRMVRAALEAGLPAVGLDVSPAAVHRCRSAGLPVLERSVFDPLPREGEWGSVLLLDGNLGIGGDPVALLARCRRLLGAGGAVVVEAHADPERDTAFTGRVRRGGRTSGPFRWAQAGEHTLLRAAAGFTADRSWTAGGRRFLRLRAD